jgi:hypothetical protein
LYDSEVRLPLDVLWPVFRELELVDAPSFPSSVGNQAERAT